MEILCRDGSDYGIFRPVYTSDYYQKPRALRGHCVWILFAAALLLLLQLRAASIVSLVTHHSIQKITWVRGWREKGGERVYTNIVVRAVRSACMEGAARNNCPKSGRRCRLRVYMSSVVWPMMDDAIKYDVYSRSASAAAPAWMPGACSACLA